MEETQGTSVDPYAAIPELYDLEHGTFDDDVDLYLNLAATTHLPVLELACGSGRLLVPLARAESRVTGVDQSAAMLARAAAAVHAAGVASAVDLVECSMVTANQAIAGPFGLIILALNGLLHAAEATDQRATLGAARALLAPGGRLALDVFNPHPEFLVAMERGVQHEGSWHRDDGSRVDKFAARSVFPASQRVETDMWYDLAQPDGTLHRAATSFPMRYLPVAELELLLELTGFADWQLYGSYDLDAFDDDSDRLIVIAR